jgi:very-short-patch-repair endonuclease
MATRSKPIDAFRRATARRLREHTTEAEDRLWRRLRRLSVSGSHFRRQVPIGPYVVDFACLAVRLVVEVDGSQHAAANNMARDAERTRWLEAEGYTVVRFWNSEITDNMDGVLTTLYAAIHGAANAEPQPLKHARYVRSENGTAADHPTPPRDARRPSPSRGG